MWSLETSQIYIYQKPNLISIAQGQVIVEGTCVLDDRL